MAIRAPSPSPAGRMDLQRLELGLDEDGNGVVALRDPDGHLQGLKIQVLRAEGRNDLELPEGHGNPPWFRGTARRRAVRGGRTERDGVTALALEGTGWTVVGLGSAFGLVPWVWLERWARPVAFSLDPGRAGDNSVGTWLAEVASSGLDARRVDPLLADGNACDYAHTCKRVAWPPAGPSSCTADTAQGAQAHQRHIGAAGPLPPGRPVPNPAGHPPVAPRLKSSGVLMPRPNLTHDSGPELCELVPFPSALATNSVEGHPRASSTCRSTGRAPRRRRSGPRATHCARLPDGSLRSWGRRRCRRFCACRH